MGSTDSGAKKMIEFEKVYYTEEEIAKRVEELARQITEDFQGKLLHLVVVLNGAAFFGMDLARRIQLDCHLYFIRAKSYQGMQQQEMVEFELPIDIESRDILVIEDIVDSGRTINQLLPHLEVMRPKSIKLCALLHKRLIPESQLKVDYVGFDCPDDWVVGYGLDHNGLFRNLPYIASLPEIHR